MKGYIKFLGIALLLFGLVICKEKEKGKESTLTGLLVLSSTKKTSSTTTTSSGTLVTAPEAIATNDTSAKGIYKGVITGSTGSFKINYDNSGKSAAPTFEYSYTPTGGVATSGTIVGTATVNGSDHTLTFSQSPYVLTMVLTSTGTISSAVLTVNGGSVYTTIYKETSTSLVRMLEGTFTGASVTALGGNSFSGVLNLTALGETSISAHSKTLGTCTSNCDADFPSVILNPTTKKLSATSTTFTCVIGANCSCQTSTNSNESVSLTTDTLTGTWTTTLSSSCVTGTGLGTLPSGYVISSGTFTGTRTR